MWSVQCEESFQELKKKLTSDLVLILPSPSESFIVYCDALNMGLGGGADAKWSVCGLCF